ncbi:glycosyltransferase family 1 protein [Bacillus dakarensis]|uniref:glycosyltransferase family 1 protein n=1 Tax=Robertmurraya dakarensis TaxID=1926278 RepID=UPI000980ADBD|nr:glycosyltransferase family 1 protein [Bacillus dakarensis]
MKKVNNNRLKRVLHVVSAMNRGGAETLLMNVYRNINKEHLQFDFIVHRQDKGDYDDEITSLGGKIYRISSLGHSGPVAYLKELRKIMSLEPYVAVHAHTDYQSGFPALAAKMAGIQRRICHSHSNHYPKGNQLKEKSVLAVLKSIIKYSATDYCACSFEAARFLFGRRLVDENKIHMLKNSIDIEPFIEMNDGAKRSVKEELHIPMDAKLIGHVGHFSQSKNHSFILKTLNRLLVENKNVYVVFAGDGPLRKQIEDEAKALSVFERVRFIGVRSDIPRLMKAFDVFLFPSLFEGFGIVTIEAQCAGTPCVVSEEVPISTDMNLDLMKFLSLHTGIELWAEAIEEAFDKIRPTKEKIFDQIAQKGFDIKRNVSDWEQLYA